MPRQQLPIDALGGISSFEHRRRMRRFRMIVDLTTSLLQRNPELSHREARCLVDCARKAIVDLSPAYCQEFDWDVRPRLEGIIRKRWPIEESLIGSSEELVN